MFRQLADILGGGVANVNSANEVLTTYRPSQLSEFLELFWSAGREAGRQAALGEALAASDHQDMARPETVDPIVAPPSPPPAPAPVTWRHVVYAALLEQTRITDIFRRVIHEWVHGERLPRATQATQRWLHTTEQLFFSAQWPYSILSVTSSIRPDIAAVRRNLYWRMLAWDLQHGTDDGRPYPYVKAETANRDFSTFFEALLTEVWRGFANVLNLIGPNETDNNAIGTLVRRMREMLLSRRHAGALSREEFDAVAMLSWFHLTVEHNTHVVNDLAAPATGVADRLRKIGELVGLPAHARSDAYFQLAQPMSDILIAIENNAVTTAGPESLYDGVYAPAMLQIITHWSIATGRNVKDPTMRQPLGLVLQTAARGSAVDGAKRDGAAIVVR